MAATASQLYTIRPYGKAFLIECSDSSKCEFYGEPIHMPSDDLTLFFHPQTNGWIVRGSEGRLARRWVKEQNESFEAAQTLATMGGSRDDNFTLERYGRGYLIRCFDSTECPWWGSEYIALSDAEDAGTAFWNKKLGGYIVRNRDADEAEYFVHLANHPKAPRTSAPTTPPRRTRRASPPPAPVRKTRKSRTFPTDATEGGEVRFTRATARRLFEAEQEGEPEVEYHDASKEMEGYADLWRMLHEAESEEDFCRMVNLMHNNTLTVLEETDTRNTRREIERTVTRLTKNMMSYTDDDSPILNRFSREDVERLVVSTVIEQITKKAKVGYPVSAARRLLDAEQEGAAGEVVEDSDSDYVPSDEETDDDAEFDEATREGPYTGMTIRTR